MYKDIVVVQRQQQHSVEVDDDDVISGYVKYKMLFRKSLCRFSAILVQHIHYVHGGERER